ncbi:MAG TPA: WYL domain-containing protein [Gemmatimonadaceae bacterium]|nr:WYL domain-containing protein [Gemmatimonadaceae bacterium]
MSETAAARLRRILLLIPRLGDGKEHDIAELAREIGADRETLVRDIETLFTRVDDPGGFVPGVTVYYTGEKVSLNSNRFLRPMRLTSSELGALELGLAMLRAERPPDERKAVNGALDRLRKAMVTMPSDAVAAGQREASLPALADPATLAAVKRGLSERRKLGIRYRGGSKSEASDRTVRPYALVVASGHWYLLAHCESKGKVVSFRLDRMEGVAELDEAYEIPATFSVDEHLNDRKVLRAGAPAKMRVRYSPRIARWIAEREGVQPDGDGSLTLDHPLLDVQWGVRHVLQYGPDAEVLEPREVREEVARRVAVFIAK